MFKYVTDSKYFKASFYQLENLNNRNRVRDAKRKNYKLFLDYVSSMDDKEDKLPKYFELYPHLKAEVEKIELESKRINKLKTLFNGSMVMEWVGLSGKELGNFIGDFKKEYSDEYLLTLSPEEVKTLVLKKYELLSK